MTSSLLRTSMALVLGAASVIGAASQPAAIRNWSAPASWLPASAKAGSARPLTVQSDLTGALPFVAVTPCRQYDSRNTSALADNTPRTISLSGAPCGIPSSAGAVSVNITVFSIAGATGNGVFKVGVSSPPASAWINYPPSESQRANAGVVSVGSGNIVVQVNQGGGSVQFTVDVNGYYVSTLNGGEQLLITASAGGGAIRGVNSAGVGVWGESSANDGVHGHTSAAGCCASGVAGLADGANYGVYGADGTGVGMFGTSFTGIGVEGREGSGSGVVAPGHTAVFGDSDTGYGVLGGSAQNDGVHGQASAASSSGVAGVHTAQGNGVLGISVSGIGVSGHSTSGPGLHGDSASGDGIQGQTASGSAVGVSGFNSSNGAGVFGLSAGGDGVVGSSTSGAGVRGENTSTAGFGVVGAGNLGVFGVCITSTGNGVEGLTGENSYPGAPALVGVLGEAHNGVGMYGASFGGDGVQGYTNSAITSGVYGNNTGGGKGVFGLSSGGSGVEGQSTGFGVFSRGDFGGTMAKYFVEPHPTDPSKEIRYASLEGNEVGTYFRGTGHLVQGQATIVVPEDFRMVTDGDGLTVQLTPIGRAAGLYCVSRSLDRIDVAGAEDVDFDYQVNGIRKAFVGFQSIHDNVAFVPRSLDAKALTVGLPPESVRRLIANGILNDDGSINEETARRLGWDQRPGWDRAASN